ncbi:MAG TPA: hypothetical protein PKC55_07685 [Dysgonomonas sp.]|nr:MULTISPECIES: hypothetical protein [unclassified Dysgonomonas]HML64691.1 hypothetical protein [Dysgonomonas sp.]
MKYTGFIKECKDLFITGSTGKKKLSDYSIRLPCQPDGIKGVLRQYG